MPYPGFKIIFPSKIFYFCTFVLEKGLFFGPLDSFLPVIFLLAHLFSILHRLLAFPADSKGVYGLFGGPDSLAPLAKPDTSVEAQIEPFIFLPVEFNVVANASVDANPNIIAKTAL